jgi:hypothetical protein
MSSTIPTTVPEPESTNDSKKRFKPSDETPGSVMTLLKGIEFISLTPTHSHSECSFHVLNVTGRKENLILDCRVAYSSSVVIHMRFPLRPVREFLFDSDADTDTPSKNSRERLDSISCLVKKTRCPIQTEDPLNNLQ